MTPDTFHCQRCGNCCRQPGEVRLTDAECVAIARMLGLSEPVFTERYTQLREDRGGLALVERPDGACVFLEGDPSACRIQAAKPQQCRDFPFTWRYENLEQVCPASRSASASGPET